MPDKIHLRYYHSILTTIFPERVTVLGDMMLVISTQSALTTTEEKEVEAWWNTEQVNLGDGAGYDTIA